MKKNIIFFCLLIAILSACNQIDRSTKNVPKVKTTLVKKDTDTSDDRSFRLLKFIEDEVIQPLPSDYNFYVVFRSHKWQRNESIYTIKSYDSIVLISYKEIQSNKNDDLLYESLEKRSVEGIDFKYTTKSKIVSNKSISEIMDIVMQSTKNLHSYEFVGMHDGYSMHVFINGKDYTVVADYADAQTMLRLDSVFTHSAVFNNLISEK